MYPIKNLSGVVATLLNAQYVRVRIRVLEILWQKTEKAVNIQCTVEFTPWYIAKGLSLTTGYSQNCCEHTARCRQEFFLKSNCAVWGNWTGVLFKIWQDVKICFGFGFLDVSPPQAVDRVHHSEALHRRHTGTHLLTLHSQGRALQHHILSTASLCFLWFFLVLELIVQDRLVQGNFVQDFLSRSSFSLHIPVLEFWNNLWGLETE